MDPQNYQLASFQSLPLMTQSEYQSLASKKRIVFWKDLILDLTDFDHPGYNHIVDEFQGKDISEAYLLRIHSLNADLIVCHRAIGRLQSSSQSSQSKVFYNSILNNQKIKEHEVILKKFDFSKPLNESICHLKSEQLQKLTEIPKIFKNNDDITFVSGKLKNFLEEEHFWISFSVFWCQVLLVLTWIFKNHEIKEIYSSVYFMVFGSIFWTLLQYYFHRFILHPKGPLPHGALRGHLLHHAFPKLKNKVALSFSTLSVKIIIIFMLFRLVLPDILVAFGYIGFMLTIIAYDSIHYYCHFGPETNIPWLKKLRINHLKHHYRDFNTNFGVTSNVWDKVFGTYNYKVKNI